MKIACVMLGSWKRTLGGREVFTYNFLERLQERGHDVVLYVAFESYVVNRVLYRNMSFKVHPLLIFTFVLGKVAQNILRMYLAHQQNINKFDIWQIVGAYPGGWLASSLAGMAPLVLRTHGDDIQKDIALNYGKRLNPGVEERIQYTLNKMDRVIALTKSVTDCYRELGIVADKIIEISNGIDINRFNKKCDKQEIRQQWNIPQHKIILLTVGRHHPKKDYGIIPKVAHLLKERGVDFQWVIIGQGTESLMPLVKEVSLEDVIRIEGEVGVSDFLVKKGKLKLPSDALISLYKCADIFVFPSRLETFGRVLIEAMAAGIPVVTTDAPGCRDVVAHERSGLLVPPGDVNAFAFAICRIIKDEELRRRLVEGGYKHSEQFDWDIIIDKYERLYSGLLK